MRKWSLKTAITPVRRPGNPSVNFVAEYGHSECKKKAKGKAE